MAFFPPEFLEEVRGRVAVSDVVGKRVKLQRRGREYVGLSPFNAEKTPSFTVNDQKQFYHCFSSGKHGDVFSFLMETEGLSFPEAVERLAGEAGLEVPKPTPQAAERAAQAAGLRDTLEAACVWFEDRLRAPEGRSALAYLEGRGLDRATMERFRLGYAPSDRHALSAHLKGLPGVGDDDLVEAGLLIRPDEGGRQPYDRFRNRVMFPITDGRGKVIAFGARLLDGDGPKYLNSPETPLFHKGRTLYGLAQARQASHDAGEIIACEGYMDVIALAQAGFPQSVAPLGTALTEDQMSALWRLAPEPVLCFDGDKAGLRAAARAAERALPLLQPGHTLRFVWLPDGMDPDDLVRKRGAKALRALLDAAEPLSAVLWRLGVSAGSVDSAERRAALRKRLAEHVGKIADRTVAAEFQREFGQRFERDFGGWNGRRFDPRRNGPRAPQGLDQRAGLRLRRDHRRLQHRILLATLVNHPALIDEFGEAVARIDSGDQSLCVLGGTLVDRWSQDLDSSALKRQVVELDLDQVLTDVLSDEVYRHAAFARPGASTDDARIGCTDIFALIADR